METAAVTQESATAGPSSPCGEPATPPFSPSNESILQESSTYELDGDVQGSNSVQGEGADPFSRVPDIVYATFQSSNQEDSEESSSCFEVKLPPKINQARKSNSLSTSPRLYPRTPSMFVSNSKADKIFSHSKLSKSKPDPVISEDIPAYDDIAFHKTTKTFTQQNAIAGAYEDILVHRTSKTDGWKLKTKSLDRTPNLGSVHFEGTYDDIVVHQVQNKSLNKPKLLPKPQRKRNGITSKKVHPEGRQKPPLNDKCLDSSAQVASVQIQESTREETHEGLEQDAAKSLPLPRLFPRTALMLDSNSEVNEGAEQTSVDDSPSLSGKEIELGSASAEDIYDDIIVYRMQNTSRSKPKLLPKPAHLQLLRKDNRLLQPKRLSLQSISTPSDSDLDDVYDDIIITAMQKQRLANLTSFEDIYDDIIIKRLQKSKPDVPQKPPGIHAHPKVIAIRRQKKLKELEAIEEIYDLDPPEAPNELPEFDEIYVDAISIDSDDSDRSNEPKNSIQDSAQSNSLVEDKENVDTTEGTKGTEPDIAPKSSSAPDLEADDSQNETYEELVIYEELRLNSEDGYQDLDKARVEALGLPENIRQRASRIVKGPERKKLKKRIKRRSTTIGGQMEQHTISEPPPSSEPSKPTPAGPPSASDDEEDESHDGYMSHGKAREVLELLLEANNVKKIAHIGKSQSMTTMPVEPIPFNEDSDVDDDNITVDLPPEVKVYQQAGILQARSPSDIAAEIKFLTDSAPKEPPPLPGVQRERAKLVTNRDSLIRRRKVLKRTNTMPERTLNNDNKL